MMAYLSRHFHCLRVGPAADARWDIRSDHCEFAPYERQSELYARGHFALNVMRWMLLGLSVGVARSLWLRWPAAVTIILTAAYGIDQSILFWPMSADLLNRIARSLSPLVHRDFSVYFLRGVFENLVSGLVIVYVLRQRSERAARSGSQTATA